MEQSAAAKRVEFRAQLKTNQEVLKFLYDRAAPLTPDQLRKFELDPRVVQHKEKLRLVLLKQAAKVHPRPPQLVNPEFQWTFLTMLRHRTFTWNPLCRIWFTLTDLDDEPLLKFPERVWKVLRAAPVGSYGQDSDDKPFYERARTCCVSTDNLFHSAWLLWSKQLDKLAEFQKAFTAFMDKKAEIGDTRAITQRLDKEMDEFSKRELRAGFTNKRTWLILRLLMPLGWLSLSEWTEQVKDKHVLGVDMHWSQQTKQLLGMCQSNCLRHAGFAVDGFQVEKKKDKDDPDEFLDEKKAAAIVNADKEEKATVVKQQKDPRVGAADLMAVFFEWMPDRNHGFEKLEKGFPESIRNSKEFPQMITYLNEIQQLCAFAETMDNRYLGKDEAHLGFLRTCVLLENELEFRKDIWVVQGEGQGGAWERKNPAFIMIGRGGFTVGCQRRLSETFATVKPAICLWYLWMIKMCDGKLVNGRQIEDWTEGGGGVPMQE
jgi:hypothetical protein